MKHRMTEVEKKVADLEYRTSITFDEEQNVWRLTCESVDISTPSHPKTGRVPPEVLCDFREAVAKTYRGRLLRGQVITAISRRYEEAITKYKPFIRRQTMFDEMRAVAGQIS